jgi:hypothetical protein
VDHLKDARRGLVQAGQREDCHLGDRCGRLLSWVSSDFLQVGGGAGATGTASTQVFAVG